MTSPLNSTQRWNRDRHADESCTARRVVEARVRFEQLVENRILEAIEEGVFRGFGGRGRGSRCATPSGWRATSGWRITSSERGDAPVARSSRKVIELDPGTGGALEAGARGGVAGAGDGGVGGGWRRLNGPKAAPIAARGDAPSRTKPESRTTWRRGRPNRDATGNLVEERCWCWTARVRGRPRRIRLPETLSVGIETQHPPLREK